MIALGKLLQAVRRRERIADAACCIARFGLPSGLVAAAVSLAMVRLAQFPPSILWATLVPMPLIIAWAWLRPRSIRVSARRLDAHYGLHDQLGTAWELHQSTPRTPSADQRTGQIVELLVQQAEARARTLQVRGVVPITVPAPGTVDLVALALVGLAAVLPQPRPEVMTSWASFPPEIYTSNHSRKRVDLVLAGPTRQSLRQLAGDQDAVGRTAERMLDILEELEEGSMSRSDAMDQLEQLEQELATIEAELEADRTEDPGILADAIRDFSEALQEHDITEESGEKFDQGRPDEGESALNEASELAESGDRQSQQDMQNAMKEAEKALAKAAKQASNTQRQLDEAERRLRRQQRQQARDPQEQERRLKRQQNEVERLRRQQQREEAAKRKLEQLRRDAQNAANQGNSARRKESVQRLSRGAAEAARTSRRTSRTQQLRDNLEETKTFVRRSGKSGDSAERRRQQFKRFSKAAKGQDGQKNGKDQRSSSLLVEGSVGDGTPDMLIEGQGNESGDQNGQQGMSGMQAGSQGLMPGGEQAGAGSVDPLGDPTSLRVKETNVQVDAKRGRGVSRAEVIRDSSQRGFATEPYREVFRDYRGHAQSALDNEALPANKRRAVKRYYQLIQPRD